MTKYPKDKTGMRFGAWTILEKAYGNRWLCQCDCGAKHNIDFYELSNGRSTKCRSCIRYVDMAGS